MTLTDVAKELNVTTMTVYRRLKRAGVNVADLRDDSTGELTSEGVAVIGGLFDATGANTASHDDATRTQPTTQPDAHPVDMDSMVEAAVLRVKLEAMEDKLSMVTAERDRLREQVNTLTVMLKTEQDARVRLLEADTTRRRGWFASWFHRGRGGE